ncbi:MAG TPA: phosphatase PAP2 family protein [Acidimicrobiales bacterium]|nr:phosphatase PAP2 family protein [Acidimicrobiales bacterium]
MNGTTLGAIAVGAVVLGLSLVGARHPTIHPTEQRVFRAVNGLSNGLYWPLWLPMQLGNLVVGTAAGLVLAVVWGDGLLAVGVVAAAALKLLAERVIRRWMAPYLAVRQRPGTSEPGAHLRGDDVPASGMSFPSGHIVLVAAVTAVIADDLAVAWLGVPALLTLAVMVGRVYVGAHNPLDVTAGLGAGLLAGGLVGLALDLV